MTTIVANLECMAADQRMTDSGPFAHVKKIHRLPNSNSLYGLCGEVSPGLVFLEWLASAKRDRMKLYRMIGEDHRYNFSVLELSADGLALWDAWGVRVPLLDVHFAVGTGAAVALSAMEEHNKSPADAIRSAIKRDECSGLWNEPQVEYLLPPELRPVTRKRR